MCAFFSIHPEYNIEKYLNRIARRQRRRQQRRRRRRRRQRRPTDRPKKSHTHIGDSFDRITNKIHRKLTETYEKFNANDVCAFYPNRFSTAMLLSSNRVPEKYKTNPTIYIDAMAMDGFRHCMRTLFAILIASAFTFRFTIRLLLQHRHWNGEHNVYVMNQIKEITFQFDICYSYPML